MKVFKIVNFVLFLSVLSACGSKTEKQDEVEVDVNTGRVDVNKLNLTNLLAEIKKREEAFKTEKTVNNRNAFLLMEAYVAFSERFNNRENADEYLFKAGELAMSQE
ncbi:MAG: hypothetical protein ACJAV5_000498, partial [Vicingaceae bacterium]